MEDWKISVKNWLGQDIVAGTVVYRGARQGDTSSFRIGVVDIVREEKRNARVEWKWSGTTSGVWDARNYDTHWSDPNRYSVSGPHKYIGGKGTCDIDTLVKMDPDMLESLNKRSALIEAARERGISETDFDQFAEDYMAGRLPF